MKQRRGSSAALRGRRAGEAEARARLDTLFVEFDRLTPDELARIGLLRLDDADRAALARTVASAARASDRGALLGEARTRAREAVLRRYAEGGLHPTWVGLNWGVSQGTAQDRAAIAVALEDAAAAAVVEDLVDPEVAHSLALDAGRVVGLSAGRVSEGSLDRVLAPPAAGLRDTRVRWAGVGVAAVVVGSTVFTLGALLGTGAGVALGVVAAGIVVAIARREAAASVAEPDPGEPGDRA